MILLSMRKTSLVFPCLSFKGEVCKDSQSFNTVQSCGSFNPYVTEKVFCELSHSTFSYALASTQSTTSELLFFLL